MPILSNARHELFAQEIAKGKSQLQAYENAGYKPNDGHAARLVGKGRVRERVAEIQAATAQITEVTIESLMREAAEIQRLAVEERQLSAANGALVAKAKLAGLWVEKTDNVNRNTDANALSDSELAVIAGAALDPKPRDENERLN